MPMPTFRRGGDAANLAAAQQSAEHNTTPHQPHPQPLATEAPAKTNRYAAKCAECGQQVAEGAGSLSNEGGKWVTRHFPTCPEASAPAEDAVVLPQINVINGKPLFDGIYTLETLTGHRTFRLRTQASDDDFMPGVQIIQYLSGQDNTHDYTSFGHVKGGHLYVWKRHQANEVLVADAKVFIARPDQAEPAVACFRCRRTLTVPASVHNGMGPECAGKGI